MTAISSSGAQFGPDFTQNCSPGLPSPSFLEILLPCNLQPAFRKCQITARTERKILITQDFPELTTGSFEYIVYAATLKVLSFTLLLECVVLLFHSMGGTPSKYISCFSLRNVCCNHVISLLISITIFFFISFAIWCDWICCKKIFLLNLSDLLQHFRKEKKNGNLALTWYFCRPFCDMYLEK